jgi:hypothetical protein
MFDQVVERFLQDPVNHRGLLAREQIVHVLEAAIEIYRGGL